MTKQEMIDFLVQCDIDYIRNSDNDELIWSYLETGFTGYSNYSEAELVREVAERKEILKFES